MIQYEKSPYERERDENIRKNQAFLATLGREDRRAGRRHGRGEAEEARVDQGQRHGSGAREAVEGPRPYPEF